MKPVMDSDLRAAVSINAIAIQTEYAQIPSTLYKYIRAKTEAVNVHRLAELDDEIEEEKIRLQVREANETALVNGEKVKRLTVDEVKALVVTSDGYRASKAKVIDAAKAKDDAAGMVDVLRAKLDMLVSLGADMRADKTSGISINEQPKRR